MIFGKGRVVLSADEQEINGGESIVIITYGRGFIGL